MRMALGIALVAMGCVRTSAVTCDDGTVCREGTECIAVGERYFCAAPGDVVCGNGRVEGDEACDDGNTRLGDGCSADCLSTETCDNGTIDPVTLVGDDLVPNEQCDDGVERAHASHDGCSSTCTSEAAHWVLRRSFPTERGESTLVMDLLRRRLVMFGGIPVRASGFGSFSNETWEHDADGWTQLPTSLSPAPRSHHAMGSDGERLILFGGYSGSLLGDTWYLDGNQWTLAPVTGPSARAGAAMAHMPGVGVVLFGGQGQTLLDDTWVFAQGAWRDITATAGRPSARESHVMVYDPVRARIVMTGGLDTINKYATDTWEFDGTRWTMVDAGSPALEGASAAFDAVRGRVLMQGGYGLGTSQAPLGRQTFSTTYAWNGATWDVVPVAGPARYAGGAATDPLTGEMVIHAGLFTEPEEQSCVICTTAMRGTWHLRGDRWESDDYVDSPQLTRMAGAYDPDRRRIVAYGGSASPNGSTQVTDTYELGAGSWKRVATTGPSGRYQAAMAFAVFGDKRGVYAFGGRSGAVLTAETWRFAGGAWVRDTTVSGAPPARALHGMAFDQKRGVIVLYGGQLGVGATAADTWELDGTTWRDRTPPPSTPGPGVRMDYAMAYDPIREQVLLFGGQGETTTLGGLWAWSGSEWTRLVSTIEPPPRRGAQMAWDAARRRMVLFGGDGSDAWEWDGTTWSFVSVVDPPAARVDHVLLPSPTGDGVMAIGGTASVVRDDTLHLVRDSGAPYAACRAPIDDDRDGVAGCEDPDCWAVCTPWCPAGAPCDASAPRCGDAACDAPRENCGSCPADCACP